MTGAVWREPGVFTALVGAATTSLAVGLLLGHEVLLLAHLAVDVLLGSYVTLLIRQRTLDAERAMKVRFLTGSQPTDPGLVRHLVNQ
jgi:hypothetical protein